MSGPESWKDSGGAELEFMEGCGVWKDDSVSESEEVFDSSASSLSSLECLALTLEGPETKPSTSARGV